MVHTLYKTCALILITLLLGTGCLSSPYGTSGLNNRITRAQDWWRSSRPFRGDALPPADISITGQIQNMLDRLVYVSPLRGYPIRVKVVNGPFNNAGTDGRTIYMNAQMANVLAQDHSLLAGVLAHELGHIIANHSLNQVHGTTENIAIQVLSPLIGTTRFGSLAVLAMREGLMMKNRAYSRGQEKEADVIGSVLAHEAGYDVNGLSRFFEQFGTGPGGNLTLPLTNYASPQQAITAGVLAIMRASPYYRTHPVDRSRSVLVNQIAELKTGEKTLEELKSKNAWLAETIQVIESRRPKNLPESARL